MYDVVVIGAGAGGLTTGLYTARANLKTLVIEKGVYGGQMQNTADIENYSGFGLVSGQELSEHMYNQAIEQGVEYMFGNVKAISVIPKTIGDRVVLNSDFTFEISFTSKRKQPIKSRSVVIATGVQHRHLGVEGEEELAGRGVSYCAVCDGAFFKGKHVVVVGGGDSALEEANYLTQFVDKVTIIHRRDKFRGQAVLQKRVFDNPKIDVVFNTKVLKINGDKKVKSVTTSYEKDMLFQKDLDCDGVFIYVGLDPITEPFKDMGILDNNGYIVTDERMETSIKGLFAVGDVRQKTVRQIATAVGDGAIAGVEVNRFLEE
jgi:thioredoxin reductase (NADPH)